MKAYTELQTIEHRPTLYIETSVFGFCFGSEPRNAARRDAVLTLFQQIRAGLFEATTSSITFTEFEQADEPLRSRLVALLDGVSTLLADRQEVEKLALAYVCENAIPKSYLDDARHVTPPSAGPMCSYR